MRRRYPLLLLIGLLLIAPFRICAQESFLNSRPWGLGTVNPHGLDFEIEQVSPAVHKWYGLRHLPETYMQPWYASDTRYAREDYTRYVSRLLEGQEFYDTFGSSLGRGWMVYNWVQEQPLPRGSRIDKIRGAQTYERFFNRLVIAGDREDARTYRLMVGDEIYTFFTPLTFYKPRFNGMRLDYGSDRVLTTLLLSRPSQPDEEERTDVTHMVGGHAEVQLNELTTLGVTYVNAHNVQTEKEFSEGNPLRGALTTQQNRALDKLWVRIRDDSPGRGEFPAILADYDIVLEDGEGRKLRGREIGLLPKIVGGGNESGRLVAQNSESILLEYDLKRFEYENIHSADITRATFELSVANDYQIELASNLQTDGERFSPEIVFLPVRRSAGNVQDNSNTGFVRIDYGLPVANELIGMDWDLVRWGGFSTKGELVLNRRFFRYPNSIVEENHQSSIDATAAYAHLAYNAYPWTVFFEGFSIEDSYTTSYWLTDAEGRIRYKDPIPQIYEFVDDDDDQNGLPEWQRPDLEVVRGNIVRRKLWSEDAWPGYDENGDFINDHNQNSNLFPDYEEPFLRFRSDRPEFLFGLDMNHNGMVDRFENDDLPDYPYRGDHRGFNVHGKANAGPDVSLTLGHQRMKLIAGDGRTRSWYGLMALERMLGNGGRLRIFEHGALVRDDIPDHLWLWFQAGGSPGRMRQVLDDLPAKNSWKNTLYADLDQRFGPGIRLQHRFKWDWVRQRQEATDLIGFDGRRSSGFIGAINKAEWSLPVGLNVLEPRWKSEYRRDRPFSSRHSTAESLEQIFFLLWTQPLFAEQGGVTYFPKFGRQLFDSQLQLGLELSRFWMLEGERDEIAEDFSSLTTVVQLTNRVAYQGYQVVTRIGAQLTKKRFAESPSENSSLFFLTMNAGLGQ